MDAPFFLQVSLVALQAMAHIASLYSYDGIVACNVVASTSEDLDSNEALFDRALIALQFLLNNIFEELLAPFA
jgi:hypothetical protein